MPNLQDIKDRTLERAQACANNPKLLITYLWLSILVRKSITSSLSRIVMDA